jgi:hypothetical protein
MSGSATMTPSYPDYPDKFQRKPFGGRIPQRLGQPAACVDEPSCDELTKKLTYLIADKSIRIITTGFGGCSVLVASTEPGPIEKTGTSALGWTAVEEFLEVPEPSLGLTAMLAHKRVILRVRESAIQSAVQKRFDRLADQWRKETAFDSSLTDMSMHPAYQQIIGMGRAAIPLILRDLSKEPDHWFWALKAITGDDPVPSDHYGNITQMALDWLQWGARNGFEL